MERQEIVNYALESGLLRRCCECQVARSNGDREWLDDLTQDMWVWLMTYDLDKLVDAYESNHLNALMTKVIINNLYSTTSPYHKTYRKFINSTDEITQKELDIPDED